MTRLDFHLDMPELKARLNADPEFILAARYLDARVRLEIGSTPYMLRLSDGVVVGATDADSGFDPYDIVLSGDETTWAEILSEVPRPFYQDFWSAMARHGFTMAGDLDLLCAYYGAIRRLGDVLREMRTEAHDDRPS